MIMNRAKSLFANERGNAFVEMALLTPVLATLLLGMIDLTRAYMFSIDLAQAAQRAIEMEQVENYDHTNDPATIKAEAETAAGSGSTATVTDWLQCGTSTTKLDFTNSCSDGVATARFVQVSVTKKFSPLFSSFFPNKNTDGTVTLDGKAGVRVQ
jgi:Flp pilus assembly protein TadG